MVAKPDIPKSAPARPATRLYLATPPLADPAPLLAALPEVLRAADIAAVLVRLAPADPRRMTGYAKALCGPVQDAGAALLIDGAAEVVARAGADGAHLTGLKALEEALPTLHPGRIAGVGGLLTRHDSMMAGEAGADYVLFGEPPARGGMRPSPSAIGERLQWWAELFEPPCAGYAMSLDEVAAFAEAGADFILVEGLVWDDPRGPLAALGDVTAALHQGIAAVQPG